MEVTGFIKKITETEKVSDSFSKREVWVETTEQYPQTLNIQFVQDACDYLDKYKVNDNVKVSINLRGRLWTSPQGEEKCFNTIQGWRIESNEVQNNTPEPKPVNVDSKGEEVEDSLPF